MLLFFFNRLQETCVGPNSALLYSDANLHCWTESHSRVIPVRLKGKYGTQLLYMDRKWKGDIAFLSLTILCFVGCSETTRIATTHSKKKKSKHITKMKLLFWDISLRWLSVQTNSSVPKFDLWVNSVGGVQVVRKHKFFVVFWRQGGRRWNW